MGWRWQDRIGNPPAWGRTTFLMHPDRPLLEKDRITSGAHVLGPVGDFEYADSGPGMAWGLPKYSTDIADAWDVVERMRDASHRIEIEWEADRGVSKTWERNGKKFIGLPELNPDPKPFYTCKIMGKSKEYAQCWTGAWDARADTAPLAICRAALRAVGVPEAEINAAMRNGVAGEGGGA